jgi:hypothetical protein
VAAPDAAQAGASWRKHLNAIMHASVHCSQVAAATASITTGQKEY